MAHARTRYDAQHAVQKTITSSQNRRQHNFFAINHLRLHGFQRRFNFDGVRGHISRHLVGQQGTQLLHQLPETLGRRILTAHQGEFVLNQRVGDDVYCAAHTLNLPKTNSET